MQLQKIKYRAKTVGTKLTPTEYAQIEELVKNGVYLGVSDFIRHAVREELESLKVIKTRDVDYSQAKKEVLSYFEQFGEAYPSDSANDLGLDLELVHKIVLELKKEGRLGVTQ